MITVGQRLAMRAERKILRFIGAFAVANLILPAQILLAGAARITLGASIAGRRLIVASLEMCVHSFSSLSRWMIGIKAGAIDLVVGADIG